MQFGDQLRRILEVNVEDYAAIADAVMQSGHDRRRLPEATAEAQKADSRVAQYLLEDEFLGAIRGGIVAEQDFVAANRLENGLDTLEEELDASLFTINRHDDRNIGAAAFAGQAAVGNEVRRA